MKFRSKNNDAKNKRRIRRIWNKNIRNRDTKYDRSIKTKRKNSKKKIEGIEKWKKELEEMELKEIVEIMVKNVWFSYLSIETK